MALPLLLGNMGLSVAKEPLSFRCHFLLSGLALDYFLLSLSNRMLFFFSCLSLSFISYHSSPPSLFLETILVFLKCHASSVSRTTEMSAFAVALVKLSLMEVLVSWEVKSLRLICAADFCYNTNETY